MVYTVIKRKENLMNTVTITEANRQFTHLMKQVDAEGRVAITKGGEIKYIVLTRKEFEKMNNNILFGRSGGQKICVEKNENEARIWKFDENFEFYTVYTADKLRVDGNHISLEAEKFFRVSFWEDLEGEPDKRAKELFEMFPTFLPEYKISVKSRDKTWE